MINKHQPGQKPLVSVIIPVFNRAGVITVTLDSIKEQTYRPIEILVVDDGSVDESALEVQSWIDKNTAQHLSAHLARQENQGAPAARNRGIEKASGRYLQFLDSDDTLEPEKIEAQVEALEATGANVAICDLKYDYGDPEKDRIVTNDGALLKRLVFGWSLSIFAPLIDANLVKNQLRWDESLKRQQDMDFIF
ncbi:MAG: glycosyltransferase family 2 protein, partial [Chloroflexia bacterium]|nr:glycosyltransferase family 2 protein [Chloroflexia bacterium]